MPVKPADSHPEGLLAGYFNYFNQVPELGTDDSLQMNSLADGSQPEASERPGAVSGPGFPHGALNKTQPSIPTTANFQAL